MGVMTAIRYDEHFKTFFTRLKANANHTTQAQIALMRKMVLTAHSLYKNKRDYVEDFSNQGKVKMGWFERFLLRLVSLLRYFKVATDPIE